MNNAQNLIKTLLVVGISWILIYLIYTSHSINIFKIVFSILVLFMAGRYIEKFVQPQRELIFLLWKDQKGIPFLIEIAKKYSKHLKILADSYLIPAFGISAIFLMDWKNLKEKIAPTLIGIIIFAFFLFSYTPAMQLFTTILGIGKIASASAGVFDLQPFIFASILLFGIAITATIALILSGANTLLSIIKLLLGEKIIVEQGATLLLPGINIPFLEGILALAVILVVHEFSHGFLAIVEKIKVNSMGIVSFGTLPIGAFVEVDEKMLEKAPKKTNSRVLLAGVGANFITGSIFLLILLGFLYTTASLASPSCLVFIDSQMTHLKPVDACNLLDKELETVTGQKFTIPQDSVKEAEIISLSGKEALRYYDNPILQFIYNLLILTASLNLIIGIINLTPVPFFDGNRLFSTLLPKQIAKPAEILALIALVVSLIPGLL